MQNQHTFAQIKIRNGIVSMHPNTSISTHAPLDLYMLTMKLASGYQPSALHNGLQLWGQNASIVQCTFKNATIGINSEQSLATIPLSLVNCWFLDNEIGLQTRGKNAVVQSSVFNNNTNGGWQALQMSGTSRVENSTFNNPGAIGGVYFEGQQGATLLALGNTFTNSETGIFVETATLTPTCNTFANLTYQGIFCLESNLYLNEEKFNLFNNNQSGITIQNSNGGNAFFMEQGFNEFVLGNAGYNHLNGYFGPGSILNMPTSTQIDADNNKMEIISIGNYSGAPVDIDLGLIPFGATPLSLHIPSNLSAVSSNCSGGSGVGAVLEEERTLQSLSSFKTINTTHYQNVNLQVALLDAVGEVSTDMFEGQDLLAISKLFEILTYNLGATTTDEAAMLEIGYKVMIKALNFSFAYGNLQLNRAEPSTFIDAYTEKIISVITSRLSNLNTLSATFEAERFRLNLDMSHVYRLAEYYDHAIGHLQTSSGWAMHMQQQQNANYWQCVCEAERAFLLEQISQEDFSIEQQHCRNLWLAKRGNDFRPRTGQNIGEGMVSGSKARIFPNPATDYITIQWLGVGQDISCQLLDINGRVLANHAGIGTTRFIMPLPANLPQGIYMLRITDGLTNELVKLSVLK